VKLWIQIIYKIILYFLKQNDMKKIIFLLLVFIYIFPINNVNANIDQTNSFNFTYDCINWQWILKTDFNLWWHHHYYRQYKINKPWIIEIADEKHTTVSRSTNISISGCDYVPETCNINNEWDWEYLEWQDINYLILNINTDLEIQKDWDRLKINWSWAIDNVDINFKNIYSWSWKNLELELNDSWIKLIEYWYDWNWDLDSQIVRNIILNNRILDWKNEFYYEFRSNNKKIIIKQRIFKRENTWVINSTDWWYEIFSAYNWTNSDERNLWWCANPIWQSNYWYCTWLDYWDYIQHHYTTTKVKLYWVSLNCREIEYSNWDTKVDTESYDWTLWGIITPEFWWDLEINWAFEWNWGTTIYSNKKITVNYLKYIRVWEIWGKKLWIKKIKASLKQNDFTLGENEILLDSIQNTTGFFPLMTFKIEDNSWNIITKIKWNYQLVLTFFTDYWQQVWTYEIPLTIIPNNNLKVLWQLNIDKTKVFATNNTEDKIKICTEIRDEFWNKIDKEYDVNDDNVENFNWIKDLNNTEWLNISSVAFENSKFCFNINSVVPGKKSLKFRIKVPKHIENANLEANWDFQRIYLNTSEIKFKKPISWKLSIDWVDNPALNTNYKFNINLENIWWITDISNWKLDINSDSIEVKSNWHKWKEWTFKLIEDNFYVNSNWELSFSWTVDADFNYLDKIKIWFNNLKISYNIIWNNISYYLDNSDIEWCGTETLWVKIYWNLQWDWKADKVWQVKNFSDLSKWSLRAKIRKNAYVLIKNMNSWDVLNWVKYIEWEDIKISWNNLWFETLIVKNWNVIISDDLNTDNKKLWIIVLKDNYNIKTDFNISWNIYVNNNVQNINAIIYADWTFRSSRSDWTSYSDWDLGSVLILNWSLFTRNTIWWSVWKNTLPWWKEILDSNEYYLANIYDLNNIRKQILSCWDDSYSFIIKYNPSIQTNPPKGFSG